MEKKFYMPYMYYIIAMIGIFAIIFLDSLRTVQTTSEEMSYTETPVVEEKEIIYLEIPYIYYDEELTDLVKANAYEDYMAKLTKENAEYWWYGYQIMIQDWEDQPEHLTDVYTEEELQYLYRCVETEVYDGDFLSKANVASVIFNRMEHDAYGNTITGVVTSENQFAYGRTVITEQTKQACAFAFEIQDTSNGALSFHSNKQTETFNGQKYIFTDDMGHHFYK